MGQHKIYTVNGFTGNAKEIAEYFGINYHTLLYRLQNGMTIENAVNTEVKAVKIYTVNDFTGNLMEIANHFGIKYTTLLVRIQKGVSIEEAVNTEPKVQKTNPKIYTVNGFTGNLREIADHFGIKYATLLNRINKNGMSVKNAVNAGSRMKTGCNYKIYNVNGFAGNLKEIADHFCINYNTLYRRITRSNMSIEEAVNSGSKMYTGKYKIYTVNGFTGNISEIAKHFGINYKVLTGRIYIGMPIENAVNTEVKVHKIYTVNDFTGNITEIAEHFGINKNTLSSRIRKGASIEEAVNAGLKMQKPNSKIYTVNGFTGNISEIAKHFGISYAALTGRIYRGMSIEEAINAGPKKRSGNAKISTVNDFTGSIKEIADHFGINYQTLLYRLCNGMSIKEAVDAGPKMQNANSKIYTVNGFIGNRREIADHFGINRGTLSSRINKNGMTIQEAVDAGPKMQKENSKIYTVHGFTGNIMEIAEHFNINYATLRSRIYNRMSIEDAVNSSTKMQNGKAKIYTVNGFTGNVSQIAEHFGINYGALMIRIYRGMTIEDAVNAGPKIQNRRDKIYTVNGFTGNITKIADHFGINYVTLSSRINKNGMTIQEAVDAGPKMQNGKAKIYTVNGFTGNLKEISEYFGINRLTLKDRLQNGMNIEEAVNYKRSKTYTVNGFTGNLAEIADHFGINYQTLFYRIRHGYSMEKAIRKVK